MFVCLVHQILFFLTFVLFHRQRNPWSAGHTDWIHVRRGRAGGGLRCGGDNPDRARQLRQVQHRHLQRRRQDPLERQLYVAQDPTHPSEQVRINFIIITITHVTESEHILWNK